MYVTHFAYKSMKPLTAAVFILPCTTLNFKQTQDDNPLKTFSLHGSAIFKLFWIVVYYYPDKKSHSLELLLLYLFSIYEYTLVHSHLIMLCFTFETRVAWIKKNDAAVFGTDKALFESAIKPRKSSTICQSEYKDWLCSPPVLSSLVQPSHQGTV